jgi:hypothetical protein
MTKQGTFSCYYKMSFMNEEEEIQTTKIIFRKKKTVFSRIFSYLIFYFKKQMQFSILSSWYYMNCFNCKSKIYCSEFCKFCGEPTFGKKSKKNSKKMYIRLFCSRFIVITAVFALIFLMMLSKLIFSPLLDVSFIKMGLLYVAFIIFLMAFQQIFIKSLPQKKVKNVCDYVKVLMRDKFWLIYHIFLLAYFFYLLIKNPEWTVIYNLIYLGYNYLNRN